MTAFPLPVNTGLSIEEHPHDLVVADAGGTATVLLCAGRGRGYTASRGLASSIVAWASIVDWSFSSPFHCTRGEVDRVSQALAQYHVVTTRTNLEPYLFRQGQVDSKIEAIVVLALCHCT